MCLRCCRQSDVSSPRGGAEQTQRMLLARLATTEDLLTGMRRDSLADQLAEVKLALAQSEYRVLELQKQLKEQGRL